MRDLKAKMETGPAGCWRARVIAGAGRPLLGGRLTVGEAAGLVVIVGMFWVLGWSSLVQKSVTYDEAQHVPVGLLYLREGDFRIEPFSSPLPRVALALPLWKSEARLPLGVGWVMRDVVEFGREFMGANARQYQGLFLRSRALAMFFGTALLVLVWGWARRLYGPAAGLGALALCALDPNIMAHARLAAVDLPTALVFFGSVLAMRRWVERRTWPRALVAGVVLGLALLSKITCVLLLPLLPALAVWSLASGPAPARWRAAAIHILVMYGMAWAVLCSFYLWKGVGDPVRDYDFGSVLLRATVGRLPSGLPLPVPRACLEGLDFVFVTNQDPSFDYLLGQISDATWPHYYLVALLAKTPLPTLLLWGFGLVSWARARGGRRPEEAWLAVSAGVFFGFVSLTSHMYIGLRYALPTLPFLFVLAARVWGPGFAGRRGLRLAAGALVAGSLVSNLWIYPDYLSYFNVAAGGPAGGHRIVADSNLDWGQDLIGLKRYLDEHKIDRVCLAYFGQADPSIYGISYRFPTDPESCEDLAVSVQFVLGLALPVVANGRVYEFPYYKYSYLQKRPPAAVIGHSIWVWRQGPAGARKVEEKN